MLRYHCTMSDRHIGCHLPLFQVQILTITEEILFICINVFLQNQKFIHLLKCQAKGMT